MMRRINLLANDIWRRTQMFGKIHLKNSSTSRWPNELPKARTNFAQHPGTYDLVISPNEITFAHGTGVLLSRLIEDQENILVARSATHYGGKQRAHAKKSFVLPHGIANRQDVFAEVVQWLAGYTIRSIICVPFFQSDLHIALAAQALTGAPLGLWIMDDNCLRNDGISREIMDEAIHRATALFAISPELKQAYQTEFRKSFSVVPPLVPKLIVRNDASPAPEGSSIVMIGNIWSPHILDQFSKVVQKAGIKIDWHSSNPTLWSHMVSQATLAKRGINIIQSEEPKELIGKVVNAIAVIIPSDPGNLKQGHEAALGDMSIPTRMPFVLATAGTPMIVVGRSGTAAANFVNRFNLGRTVEYDAVALNRAVKELGTEEVQADIRIRAAKLAPSFSFEGTFNFMVESILDSGRRPHDKFETLFPPSGSYAIYHNKPMPRQFTKDFGEVIQLCDRLKASGFVPDFILDVGASTGIWSSAVVKVFDKARYVLCDPMFSRYGKLWIPDHFEKVEAAISDKRGKAIFSVSSDLYGSSLISVSDIVQVTDRIEVSVRTVDEIAKEKKLKGRGLLKVDVQYAEHLVISGAKDTLKKSIDIVVLELTLGRADPKARTLLEVSNQMDELGFRIFDQIGSWRMPKTGEMEQMDLVFVRKDVAFATQQS